MGIEGWLETFGRGWCEVGRPAHNADPRTTDFQDYGR